MIIAARIGISLVVRDDDDDVGLLRGEPLMLMLLTCISLAVAAIPEALPAVVSISLALVLFLVLLLFLVAGAAWRLALFALARAAGTIMVLVAVAVTSKFTLSRATLASYFSLEAYTPSATAPSM